MADNRIITRDLLLELLRYEPETGKLYWRERGEHLFKAGEGSGYTADKVALRWNINFSGEEAFATTGHNGYKVGSIFNNRFAAHRVIWMMAHGEWPNQIDHINGNPSDNRFDNLRDVTASQNCQNRKVPINSKSGVPGVIYIAQWRHWRATIGGGRTRTYLGSFPTKEAAIAARKAAEEEFGYHPNHGRN